MKKGKASDMPPAKRRQSVSGRQAATARLKNPPRPLSPRRRRGPPHAEAHIGKIAEVTRTQTRGPRLSRRAVTDMPLGGGRRQQQEQAASTTGPAARGMRKQTKEPGEATAGRKRATEHTEEEGKLKKTRPANQQPRGTRQAKGSPETAMTAATAATADLPATAAPTQKKKENPAKTSPTGARRAKRASKVPKQRSQIGRRPSKVQQ
mmetsp:Transcript_18856/g.40503  ORF Transcript_18856/g.40503 Transcript_18856/m.40503 type:complete len:207 (-) Transcript_18856:83-703(-)